MGLSLDTNNETAETSDLKLKLRMREARLSLNLECARGRDCDIENIGSLSEAQLSMNCAIIRENKENDALNRVFLSEAQLSLECARGRDCTDKSECCDIESLSEAQLSKDCAQGEEHAENEDYCDVQNH